MLEHLPVGVLIADAGSRRLVYGNRKFEQHMRRPFVPQSLEDYASTVPRYHPDGSQYDWTEFPLARALRGKLVAGDEPRLEIGGERVHLRVSAAPLFDESGALTAAVSTFEDISVEVRMLEERNENERTREVFIGALGHDLRNPLAAIAMNAEAVRRADLPDPVGASVERILRSADRMARMIADLLDFTRVRQGTMSIERIETDVGLLSSRVLDELEGTHPGRIKARIEPVTASIDPDRFAQVLGNLVGNALKHGDGKGVRVTVGRRADGLEISVHNAGKPIEPADAAGLFDPFRRGRDAGSRDGLGLGLYIVDHIVRAHGGAVEVESTAAGGTTFRAVFPAGGPGPAPAAGHPPPA